MPAPSFAGLPVVAAVALGAPLLVGLVPAVRVPAVVLEIVAGIVVGPSGFGWVRVDVPIQVLSLIGLAFLLFLAGLEIDVSRLRGPVLRVAALGYGFTLGAGLGCGAGLRGGGVGLAFGAAGRVTSPVLAAVALSATSLGQVVPVLEHAGQRDAPVGRLTVAGASVADFAAVALLPLLFSETAGGTGSRVLLPGLFVVLARRTSQRSRRSRGRPGWRPCSCACRTPRRVRRTVRLQRRSPPGHGRRAPAGHHPAVPGHGRVDRSDPAPGHAGDRGRPRLGRAAVGDAVPARGRHAAG